MRCACACLNYRSYSHPVNAFCLQKSTTQLLIGHNYYSLFTLLEPVAGLMRRGSVRGLRKLPAVVVFFNICNSQGQVTWEAYPLNVCCAQNIVTALITAHVELIHSLYLYQRRYSLCIQMFSETWPTLHLPWDPEEWHCFRRVTWPWAIILSNVYLKEPSDLPRWGWIIIRRCLVCHLVT